MKRSFFTYFLGLFINELKPKIRLDLNYHMYYERVSRMLNTMGKQVANCYSSGFKHCISYNATEGVYATNPYDERDLVLSISPSVPILINQKSTIRMT